MSSTKFISIALDAPIQSWGTSKTTYGFHNTNRFPTRSAVLMGILANMGIQREYTKPYLEKMKSMKMTTIVYSFGTVFKDDQNCRISFDESGNPRKENIMQHKEYIVGGRFGVVFSINDKELLNEIQIGFGSPKYPFYAGRANCPLSFHPYVGTYDNMDDALKSIHDIFSSFDQDIGKKVSHSDPVMFIEEPDDINPIEDIKIFDVPLGMYKGNYRYDARYVRERLP